jgi:Domain of unknown function (DUF4262)
LVKRFGHNLHLLNAISLERAMLRMMRRWIDKARIEAHDGVALERVKKHGWTGTFVFEDGDDEHNDFAYTVGFSDFGAPELLIFNLDPQLINGVFWEYFLYMRSGQELVDGLVFRPTDMAGFECMLRQAVKRQTWEEHVFDSIRYSRTKGRGDRPEVMQIVWPSAQTGQYPWSPGCPESVISSQPALYEGSPLASAPVFSAAA